MMFPVKMPAVGFKWNSKHGERAIVDRREIRGADTFLVTTGGGLPELIQAAAIEREIYRDTKNYENVARVLKEQKGQSTAQRERESWHGYTDTLSPMARARAIAALDVSVNHNGHLTKRGDLVVKLVGNGWRVTMTRDGRVLANPETGSFLSERQVSKVAMDLASYLSRR